MTIQMRINRVIKQAGVLWPHQMFLGIEFFKIVLETSQKLLLSSSE